MRPLAEDFAMARDLDLIADQARHGVTIVCGFPAAGKSTAARHLAGAVGAVLIDKDDFAPGLEESVMTELSGNPHDRDSETYMRVVNPNIYAAILHQALIVGARCPAVVDAPFLGHLRAALTQGIPLARHIANITPIVAPAPRIRTVWVTATPDRIRERMSHRAAARDAGKLADWNLYRSTVLEEGLAESAGAAVDYVVRN